MESGPARPNKVSMPVTLLILAVIAVPAFFWFRFLYDQFVAEKITPQMAKMRDSALHAKPPPLPHAAVATKPTGIPNRKEQKTADH